jgi:hypothetical protein
MRSQPGPLIYEDKPPYDRIEKSLSVGVPAAFLIAGLILLRPATRAGVALLVDAAVFGLAVHFVIPRRYQLFATRLRIVLGWPLRWDIPLSTIAAARPARGVARWFYWGVRLATSSGTLVEVERKKGWNVILSPSSRDVFLAQLNEALDKSRQPTPDRR